MLRVPFSGGKEVLTKTPKELVVLTDPQSRAADAYRSLYAALMLTEVRECLTRLAVTSPGLEASRAAVACNLAALAALGGARTLLLDADTRHPAIHKVFGLTPQPGFVECLIGGDPSEAVRPSGLDRLFVVTAGGLQPMPVDVTTLRRIPQVLADLFDGYDCSIVSVPPLVGAGEALAVLQATDGAILVLEAYSTKRERAQRAQKLLASAKVNLLGAVLTNAKEMSYAVE